MTSDLRARVEALIATAGMVSGPFGREYEAVPVTTLRALLASDPAPAADGGEVKVDSLVRLLARHVLSHLTPEHCTADCMARAILASPLLDHLRRTERAEGAREAAERAWDLGRIAAINERASSRDNPYRAATEADQ